VTSVADLPLLEPSSDSGETFGGIDAWLELKYLCVGGVDA
jgi:hypothetical protein